MVLLPPVITIDGPSGVGKSVLCKLLANKLGWNLLDSGIVYRIIALAALYYHVDIKSEEELVKLAVKINFSFEKQKKNSRFFLLKKKFNNKINNEVISNIASIIAEFPKVRKVLLFWQKNFRMEPGLIANGRDMGTTVFPDASIKIFLDATFKERVIRRKKQLQKKGFNVNINDIILSIQERDYRDYNRLISPLIPAKDALFLDSTKLSVNDIINQIIYYIKKNKYYLYNMHNINI